jgi:hypothetical protein
LVAVVSPKADADDVQVDAHVDQVPNHGGVDRVVVAEYGGRVALAGNRARL